MLYDIISLLRENSLRAGVVWEGQVGERGAGGGAKGTFQIRGKDWQRFGGRQEQSIWRILVCLRWRYSKALLKTKGSLYWLSRPEFTTLNGHLRRRIWQPCSERAVWESWRGRGLLGTHQRSKGRDGTKPGSGIAYLNYWFPLTFSHIPGPRQVSKLTKERMGHPSSKSLLMPGKEHFWC